MAPQPSLYDKALVQFRDNAREVHRNTEDGKGKEQLEDFLSSKATPQDAIASAKDLSAFVATKWQSPKSGDKDIIPQKWIDNIMGNIDNAIRVGDVLLSKAPESVSMAWFAVSLGLGAIQSNYKLYGVFGSGLTSMTEVMVLIAHYERLYDERGKPGFVASDLVEQLFKEIIDVYAAVLDFLFSIKRHVSRGPGGKVVHFFKDLGNIELNKFQQKQHDIATLKDKVLVDSQAAFQGRVFDQLSGVQGSLLSLQNSIDSMQSFAGLAQELAQGQVGLAESFARLEAFVKPKSRWDYAKEGHEKNTKSLGALMRSSDDWLNLLQQRHAGTLEWLFQSEEYKAWQSSDQGAILLIKGQPGAGKSIALATIAERLSSADEGSGPIVCFLSCATADIEHGTTGSKLLIQLEHSLLHLVYRLAVRDAENVDVLEESNKIFAPSKSVEAKQSDAKQSVAKPGTKQLLSASSKASDSSLPAFHDAIPKLAKILQRDVLIVIDAIEQLSGADQDTLFRRVVEVTGGNELDNLPTQRVRVILSTRASPSISASPKQVSLELDERMDKDMRAKLSAEIKSISGLTDDERCSAEDRVMLKAGRSFEYITQVAVPFLREPYQRPFSRRLDALPKGVEDTYVQALRGLKSNFVGLLQTAITWTLYTRQTVRLREVMDDFSGIFDGEHAEEDADIDPVQRYAVTDLELQQIEAVKGPFLKVWRNQSAQWVIDLVDTEQIRQFCASVVPEACDTPTASCERCQSETSSSRLLALSEKEAHLLMALKTVQNLNSPAFQKRYDLVPYEAETADNEADGVIQAEEVDACDESKEDEVEETVETSESALEQPIVIDGNVKSSGAEATEHDEVTEDEARVDKRSEQVKAADDIEESPEDHDGYVSDGNESVESDDVNGPTSKRSKNLDVDSVVITDGSNDNDGYSINQWFWHVREADRLWSWEEKAASADWQRLLQELDKFGLDTPRLLEKWEDKFVGEAYLPQNPDALHVAAHLGLPYWLHHLIHDRAQDPNAVSAWRTALQAAAEKAICRKTLSILLEVEKPDAWTAEDTGVLPPISEWLLIDGSKETIQLFMDKGIDFTVRDDAEDTPLHCWALNTLATDVAAFELILQAYPDPEQAINAPNEHQKTPLHHLLGRSDVPEDLLRAFLRAGAKVDCENDESERPLQKACLQADAKIVQIILDCGVEDIDDPDDCNITALHSAVLGGSLTCVNALLAYHANFNARNIWGRSALHLAARDGESDIAQALINAGAEIEARDNHKRTPLWYACASPSEETARIVLDALTQSRSTTDINVPSKTGRSPLRMAATHGFVSILKDLIEAVKSAGADVTGALNMQDEKMGATALHRAAWRGELGCVKVLLESGSDASLEDNNEQTALLLANVQWGVSDDDSVSNFELIILELLDHDRSHATSQDLPTTAAANNSVKVLEKLHQLGIDLNQSDSYGWTPLTIARRQRCADAEHYLRQQLAWSPSWLRHNLLANEIVFSDNGRDITYDDVDGNVHCITTKKPLPAGLDSFYFEITSIAIVESEQPENPILALGFGTHEATAYNFPGWPPKPRFPSARSWAYHGDDGWFAAGADFSDGYGQVKGACFGPGDTVGCGVDLDAQKVWFTKNGEKVAFEHEGVSGRLFPMIGLQDVVHVETRFSPPFAWAEANKGISKEDSAALSVAGTDAK